MLSIIILNLFYVLIILKLLYSYKFSFKVENTTLIIKKINQENINYENNIISFKKRFNDKFSYIWNRTNEKFNLKKVNVKLYNRLIKYRYPLKINKQI